jgi:photosystem II stability/assembly factor-like uncharacterized protein
VFYTHSPKQPVWRRGERLLSIAVRDIACDPLDPDVAYAGVFLPNKWSVFITEHGGATWRPTQPPARIPERYLNDTMAIAVARVDDQSRILYAGTNGCGVFSSRDQGQTWWTGGREDCVLPPNAPKNVQALAVDAARFDTLYAAADNDMVFVSRDGAETWEPGAISLTTNIRAIDVDPQIANRVYLVAGVSGFWRSDDGGRTWRSYSRGLEEKPLSAMVVLPDRKETLFVGTWHGEVWKTNDGGESWRSVRHNLAVTDIATMDATGWADGIWIASASRGGGGIDHYQPGRLESLWRR